VRKNIIIIAPLLALIIAFVTCGGGGETNNGGGGSPIITPSAILVSGITLNRNTMTLAVGDENSTLVPAIYPENATNKNIAWASSNKSVATVSADGIVSPISVGSAIIMATTHDGNQTADCAIEVVSEAIPAEDAYLNKNEVELIKGGTDSLAVHFIPSSATSQNVTWTSSNPLIATVDKNGVVTAISEGEAEIIAVFPQGTGGAASPIDSINMGDIVKTTTPGRTVPTTVRSSSSKVSALGVSLDRKYLVLAVSSTHVFFPTVAPANATNVNVTYKSSNTKVAAVSTLGVVTGKSVGTATITVTTKDGDHTDTCEVMVEAAQIKPTSVTLDKTTLTFTSINSTERLAATVSPSNATDKRLDWLSSNQNVAVVNENGTVQARGLGTATIIAKTQVGERTASCTVNVTGPTVNPTSVSLNKTSTTLSVGDGEILIATVLPSNATNKNVTWSTNNSGVATVSNGVIVAKSPGNAAITVATSAGGKTATCQVTVTGNVSPTGVSLNNTSITLPVGSSSTLVAAVSPSNATNKSVAWSNSSPSVATVNNGGLVTGVSAGTAVITATTNEGNKTATCQVTVTPVATGVSLNKTSTTISIGGSETLVATVQPNDAANKNVTWSSNSPGVAVVNASGLVTGVSAGTATITVLTQQGGHTAFCTVNVTNENIPPTGVTLNKTSTTISVGVAETLVATVLPSNATNKNVAWSSSSPSVANVNSSGLVTGVSTGSATIIVSTQQGGYTAFCSITVNPAHVAPTGVSLNKTAMTLGLGSSETLVATVQPSNATNKNVTWSSSNPSVAMVNASGLVTGVTAGAATIVAATQEGGHTATCNVTVQMIPVASVMLNKTATTLPIGANETLVATVLPSNATNKNVTWSSSSPSVATVNNGGLVTSVSSGTATITAVTQEGAKQATCTVTVVIPVTGITMTYTTTRTGDLLFTATIQPSDATNKNMSWSLSSSRYTVPVITQTPIYRDYLTMSGSGSQRTVSVASELPNGVSAGSITATTSDGAFKARAGISKSSRGTITVSITYPSAIQNPELPMLAHFMGESGTPLSAAKQYADLMDSASVMDSLAVAMSWPPFLYQSNGDESLNPLGTGTIASANSLASIADSASDGRYKAASDAATGATPAKGILLE
jgi:uncharacterized protein YjdB